MSPEQTYSNKKITGLQSSAARSLLRIGLQETGKITKINPNSLSRFESGRGHLNENNLNILQCFYEESGIEFSDYDGLRRSPTGTFRTLTGVEGFSEFINDVYKTVRNSPDQEVVVSNVNEKHFNKWFGIKKTGYLRKMADLHDTSPFSFKILIEEGDDYFLASDYAEYRWLDKSLFAPTPFYSYGDKTALILFKEETVNIFILDNADITESFRRSFYSLWKSADIPT